MTIAVLGWGSLIWNPGELPLSSDWFEDGPHIPVEFVRQSKDGRLTLVVHGTDPVPTLWATMDVPNLDTARRELGWREGIISRENTKMSRHIGWWSKEGRSSDRKYVTGHNIDLDAWAREKGVEGVVWTALPPKWQDVNGTSPTLAEATDYLESLPQDQKARAFEYIRNAPYSIKTPFRHHFETRFPELDPTA